MKSPNCNANQPNVKFRHRWIKLFGAILAIALVLLLGWGIFSHFKSEKETPIWEPNNIDITYLKDSTQYVSDPDHLLVQEYKDTANYYLDLLHHELGIQNVFILVNHVKNGDAFRMAIDVGNLYGVGEKEINKGLVTVIAVKDRSYGIATGLGLEEMLSDSTCNDIAVNYIKPNMRAGKTGPAVAETCKAIYWKIKTSKNSQSAIPDELSSVDSSANSQQPSY